MWMATPLSLKPMWPWSRRPRPRARPLAHRRALRDHHGDGHVTQIVRVQDAQQPQRHFGRDDVRQAPTRVAHDDLDRL
jgi:hypothetical protein